MIIQPDSYTECLEVNGFHQSKDHSDIHKAIHKTIS